MAVAAASWSVCPLVARCALIDLTSLAYNHFDRMNSTIIWTIIKRIVTTSLALTLCVCTTENKCNGRQRHQELPSRYLRRCRCRNECEWAKMLYCYFGLEEIFLFSFFSSCSIAVSNNHCGDAAALWDEIYFSIFIISVFDNESLCCLRLNVANEQLLCVVSTK